MAHRSKRDGPRDGQMSRATWAALDRAKERITRREGREACEAGRDDADTASREELEAASEIYGSLR